MQYVMKAGMLCDRNQKKVFARVKREFAGTERSILSADGAFSLRTDIRRLDAGGYGKTGEYESGAGGGDVRCLEYVLCDGTGQVRAAARPDYAEDDMPEKNGWPPYRVPKVDHARLKMDGREFELVMESNTAYTLSESSGEEVLKIFHRGLTGGWDIEAADRLLPETVCGLYAFCRYLEQENELMIL